MDKVLMIKLSRDELETVIIRCVNACLEHHAATPAPTNPPAKRGEAKKKSQVLN